MMATEDDAPLAEQRSGSLESGGDDDEDVTGDGFSNAEMIAALDASRKDAVQSKAAGETRDDGEVKISRAGPQGVSADGSGKTGATSESLVVDSLVVGEQGGRGPADSGEVTTIADGRHPLDLGSVPATLECQEGNTIVPIQSSFAGFAAEVIAAASGSGNDFQGDTKGVRTETDVVMADVSHASEAEAEAEAGADQGVEAARPRSSRKRGAPKKSRGELTSKQTPSRRAKASRKSQPSDSFDPPSAHGEVDTHSDLVMADDSGDHASAHGDVDTTPVGKEPRRSGRRAARKTYMEEDSDAEFNPAPKPLPKSSVSSAQTQTSQSRRGGGSRIWTPDHLLQDPKSKLVKADITAILKDPRAWTSLKPEQQSKIISLLPHAPALAPDPTDPTAPLPNIPQQMLATNSAFRADIAMFQDDLSEGRLDPAWQHDALVAMERRAQGEFDEWKEKEVEAFWGQKQKLSYDVLAGESSKVKLETLVAAGCFELGDVWLYSRTFGKGKNAVKIEKEATITSITQDNRLTFRFPDGQRKFSSASAGEDVETEALDGLQQLADQILETDGRISAWRHVNAWKEIRCFRKNQDIGSLWEIREVHWARQQGDAR